MITFGGIKNKLQSMDTTAVYVIVSLMHCTLKEMEPIVNQQVANEE